MKQFENEGAADVSKAFWKRKAAGYPLPFDEKTFAATSRLFSLVRRRGVEFRDADILDIGCGTGIHALPMAREARKVIGLDASQAMAGIMGDEIARHGFGNVHAICSGWNDVDVGGSGFADAFDIVWTSMSPAVRSREDLMKMESCSRRWCVYIGWGRKRINALLEAAFKLHGLDFGPPPGAGNLGRMLSESGRKYSIDRVETSWEWSGTMAAAVEDIAGYIEMAGFPPNREKLKEMLSEWETDGTIRHTTEVEMEVLVWEV